VPIPLDTLVPYHYGSSFDYAMCVYVKQFLREAIDCYGISDWYYSGVPNTVEV
jgi:hypothetical protein